MAETCKKHLHNSLLFFLLVLTIAQDEKHFVYNGFHGTNLHLDGLTTILPNGLLQMTNSSFQGKGHAFHPYPIKFNKTPSSFSTIFSFAIITPMPDHCGHGLAFVISPSMNFDYATPAEFLGLFNVSNNGLNSNRIFAVELDILQNAAFHDIDGNHVGIDVNGLVSIDSSSASYYDESGKKKTLQLSGGNPMMVWIDYNGEEMLLEVTLAPIKSPKPRKPLLSTRVNLSSVLLDSMYVGFSSGTGLVETDHYVSGWSWSQIGQARELDLSKLSSFPEIRKYHNGKLKFLYMTLGVFLLLMLEFGFGVVFVVWKTKYKELKENWEEEFISHRFSFKDLYVATKGFSDSELLGSGGFGKVYRGIISSNHIEVAVKRISHDSKQGMREFVSEIVTMRRLRHRNLVQLLGYCRRKGELLLVYEYMPNGSLDKFLFKAKSSCLTWYQRYNIVKGVAFALVYLHEEWEQVVLHRDVKASNVLLDADMNARLGDFGLARLYDHESDPRSTRVVGTFGYLAPELSITGKPSTSTDVFAYGVFLLEVACGRRPNSVQEFSREDFVLVDWVYEFWKKGLILDTCDPKLQGNYEIEEMKLVLKLGLLCANPKPEGRPSMRHVVQYLNGDCELPEISSGYNYLSNCLFDGSWGISGSFPSISNATLSSEISIIQGGR